MTTVRRNPIGSVAADLIRSEPTRNVSQCCERMLESSSSPSASYYVFDIAVVVVFLGSLFSREFAGVTGLVFKAICGRDGFRGDFGRGRYENLSGAISWLTFLAGGAADVRRCRSDWRRELAESTICFQRKPRSFRCSAQSVGSRGVRRINVLAVSCGGFRPLLFPCDINPDRDTATAETKRGRWRRR